MVCPQYVNVILQAVTTAAKDRRLSIKGKLGHKRRGVAIEELNKDEPPSVCEPDAHLPRGKCDKSVHNNPKYHMGRVLMMLCVGQESLVSHLNTGQVDDQRYRHACID